MSFDFYNTKVPCPATDKNDKGEMIK